tara:strand:+ start:164 stop:556 length:393 start_codon:yes stop_codon:yes gene_type:complete
MAPKDPSRRTDASVKECVVVLNGIEAIGASRLLHISVAEAPGALVQSRLWLLIQSLIAAMILSASLVSCLGKASPVWVNHVEVFINQNEHVLLRVELHLLKIRLSGNYDLLLVICASSTSSRLLKVRWLV